MAHFAQLNGSNVVVAVIVISNDVLNNAAFPESEEVGIAFCKSLYGNSTEWRQCSYNRMFRNLFPSVGYQYLSDFDIFVPQKPYASWILDTESDIINWKSPVPPTDSNCIIWNESILQWEST